MLLPTLLTEFPHKLFDDILYRIQKMMSKAASIDFLGLKRVKKYKKKILVIKSGSLKIVWCFYGCHLLVQLLSFQ